ncbi:MAG TPA: hypothetical protein VFA05_00490 [Gaiellaceae bacterium]|nr:hypothetical protein [Gaiellaceae bacterium]
MRSHRFDVGLLAVVFTGAYAYFAFALPGDRTVATHVYELALGALLMFAVLAELRQALPPREPSRFEAALRERARSDPRLEDVDQLEREVTLAIGTAYDLHVRLLPQLREIAQTRLARTGRVPGPETLGRWWELLRPDRPEPGDRFAPGIPRAELRALVADLEQL